MKVQLNKKGIATLEKRWRNRVRDLQRRTAETAASYLINFGYHSIYPSGPNRKSGPGWSYYYAANWNWAVNSPNITVITDPPRDSDEVGPETYSDELMGLEAVLAEGLFQNAKFDDVLYVTNSVNYGPFLNDGGEKDGVKGHPNRFIELCESYLIDNMPGLIRQVTEGR